MVPISFLRKFAALLAGAGLLLLAGCDRSETSTESPAAPAPSASPALKPALPNSFAEVTAQLDPGGDFYFYLSTAAVLGNLSHGIDSLHDMLLSGSASQSAGERDEAEKGFALLKDVVQKSGVEQITGVGGSSFPVAPGVYRNKLFVHHYPGQDAGILWSLYGRPVASATGTASGPLDNLNLLPANTGLAAYGDFDLAGLIGFVRQEADQSSIPEVKQAVAQWQTQFAGLTGLKLDDVLESLNGSMGMVLTLDATNTISIPGQQQTMPTPRLALLISVHNDLIFDQIDKMAGGMPGIVKVEEPDLRMRTMPFGMIPGLNLRPTVASWSGLLIIASDDQLIRDMIAVRKGTPGYKSTLEYATLAAGLPAQGNGFALSTQRFADVFRNFESQSMANQPRANPGQAAVMQHWFSSGHGAGHFLAVYSLLPNGWLSVSQGSQGSSQLILPMAITPAAIAGAFFMKARTSPPIFRPAGPALAAQSVGHAKQICLACVMYASANGGNFPPSLDALFPSFLTDRSVLASPFAPGVPDGYTYTPGLKLTDPADTVLLEDKFAREQNLRVVAHVDGKTAAMPVQ